MSLNKAKDSALPTTAVDTAFLVTPEEYIVEIHEIGVSKTNPITGANNGAKVWDKTNNKTLWKGNSPLVIDVAPGKKMANDLVMSQPPLGKYNYNYVLLKKSIKLKITAEFQGGEKFYSKNNGKSTPQDNNTDYAQFTENIVNFNFNAEAWDTDGGVVTAGSSSYFKDTANSVEGLLLRTDKLTKSNSNANTEYILAVYDCTSNPLSINDVRFGGGGFKIAFSSSNSAQISSAGWNDLTTNPIQFNSLPPKYVTSSK